MNTDEIKRLTAEVARFSSLADEHHDLLCAERRENDRLRGQRIQLDVERSVLDDKVARLKAELKHAEQRRIDLLDDYQVRLATAGRRLATARADTIAEAIAAVRAVIKGWNADLGESWDERPDLSFEAADKIAGANEIVAVLEALKRSG